MKPQTTAEKIISRHCGKPAYAGEIVIANIDFAMCSDTTGPIAIHSFREMQGKHLFNKDAFAIVIDHATPAPNQKIANLHRLLREFAQEEDCILFESGDGICHQLVIENKLAKPGDLILGADSHTCTYGAVGALSSGVGSTDLAVVMLTGKNWLQVPQSIRIRFRGMLRRGVAAKDIVLYLISILRADGATYQVLEFIDADNALDVDQRMTICNMAVEMGAKGGLFPQPCDIGDEDAEYAQELVVDLDTIEPQIACPHQVENVVPLSEKLGMPVQQVFIGSCTNGRLSDLQAAAEMVKGRHIAPGVRLLVAPASRSVMIRAIETGVMVTLVEAGAQLLLPGCGPCVGTLGGIPGDGDTVLSTSNRNFLGRMGNNQADIYLCSPETAIASAIGGVVTDPRKECV